MAGTQGLRQRKKERTRQALIEAAYQLFDEKGFERTTVAEITALADVSTGTFFNYFDTKDEVLFVDTWDLLSVGVEALAARSPDEGPVAALGRALLEVVAAAENTVRDLSGGLEAIRMRTITAVPELRGKHLTRQLEAQQMLAPALARAFPDELDEFGAAMLVGGVMGAIVGAAQFSMDRGASVDVAVTRAIEAATRAWVGFGQHDGDAAPPWQENRVTRGSEH